MKATSATAPWLVTLALLLVGSNASAQTPVQSFTELQPLLKPGQTVFITDSKGDETKGRVVSILGNQIEIKSGRVQLTFTEDSVRRIQKDDSTWNGILIGGGIGFLLGAWALKECDDEACLTPGIGALLGVLVGETIDGGTHRTLFVSPNKTRVSIAPLLGRNRFGLAATIRLQGRGR